MRLPTRIAVLHDGVVFGGAERYLEVLLEGLVADGAQVLAVVPAEAEAQLAARLGAVAEVVAVPGLLRRPSPAAARASLAARRALRRWRPDLVHLNLTDQGDGTGLVAAVLGLRTPVVATLHNAVPGVSPARDRLSGAVLRRPDLVLAVSEAVGRWAVAAGARTTVVHNGLPPVRQVDEPRAALGLPGGGDVVGGIGRLRSQKGWDVLGSAASRLVEARPDLRVVVVGEGPHRERLETGSPQLALLGARPDAAAHVSAFTVLAVPSRFEAFGLVAVEAMHAGVPVVASRVGGLPEVLGDAGVLVEPEDPEALADALGRVLEDPQLRRSLAERGAVRAAELFSPEAMVRGTQAAYARVRRAGPAGS